MNTQLNELVDSFSAPAEWTDLKSALEARENEALDNLRMAASMQGLHPAIVQHVVSLLGLGTDPTPEEAALYLAQAQQAIAEMQEQYRQMLGDE